MVVTRRVPVPPAPTTSRTASTQNLHSSRNKSQLSQRVGDNKPSSEDKKALPLPPTKHTSTDTSKKRHSGSILSSFSFLILTLFSLYAVLTLHPSPVESLRNVLSVPNDNLVKPYILPPLRAALSHPVIEPHVTKIQVSFQPYAQRIEIGVRPVLAGVSKIEESHVRPLVRHGTIALYVFIRKSCQQFVIPSYNSYLRPYIQPYVDRWNFFYSHNVEPRLRTSVAECTRHYHKIQPHVNKAWRTARRYSVIVHSVVAPRVDRFYKTTQPHMMTLWVKGRPRMIAGWRCLKVQGIKGLSVLRTYAAVVAVRLGEARRKFVDPHIKRIWEKVESRTAIIDARSSSFSSMSSSTVTTATQDINIENSAIMTPNAPLASETHTTTPLPRLTEATVKSHTSVTKTVINDRTVESPASILSESIGIGVVAEVVLASEVDHDVSMDVPIATYAEVPDSKVPEATPTSQETTAPVVSDREDESVDDFLLQLGVFLTEQPDAQESVSLKHEPLTDHTFSAKQDDDAAAVISAKITAKRIALVNRHNNWQAQLDRLFDSRERDLRISLVTIRKRAVKELKGLLLNGGQESEREHVVESIEQEAGRLVKGIQGYLKKARDGKEKLGNEWYDQLDDKKRQWETVLDKVNEKFAEKVRGVQEEVHTWYLGIRQKEADEALKVIKELRSLAEQAQADIGIEYAWLEDVTYDDWQKYHDLMRSAERFDDMARAIQNGTHAHPPVDPLLPALDALEKEVQEVISGFGVRFSMLRSEGNDLHTKPEPEMPSNAALPTTSDEPRMSILPISSDAQDPLMMAPSDIILGKSKEQIKQAIKMAGFNANDNEDNHTEL